MVMVTVSVAVKLPSLTVNSNVKSTSAKSSGAVNEAVLVLAPVKVTLGEPAVCRHE